MWVLVGVMLASQGVGSQPINLYDSMELCFEAREQVMQTLPKPKVNYELVCVRTDLFDEV